MTTRRARIARTALLAGIVAVAAAPARPCDSAACLLQTRGNAGVPSKGRWQADITWRHTSVGDGREGTRPTDDVRRPWVDFARETVWPGFHREARGRERFLQVDLGYGLGSRWAMGLSVPVHTRRVYDVEHGSSSFSYEPEGLGDTLATVRRGFGGGWVAGLGLKLPSGRSDVLDPTGTYIIDPSLQPGSGSLDMVATVQRSFRLPAMVDLSTATSYQANRGSARDYEFGDDAIASATFARRAYAFLQVPVYRRVNERQLTPDYSLILGASRTF